ncbi:response regulator [Mycolicibacterium confluentis]|uniref:Response regulator n=1 Tax=Mycolicibacterium confluentis TaxID=28047 RepID=A0A7I7XYT7_9MYCO|nr:response regulator transcription factor [Mycolicibacterium confluentis]MCV7321453.1 response regulator transcription factor [Mycolicibacterium confluentis]BBZ34459.1 response regulator [Mycolicibacterium confluentis]
MLSSATTAVRCLIVDDSAAFRDAAVTMLARGGITVVGTAQNGAEAVRQNTELRPDVALVDVDLGAESGFDVAEELSGVAVILISTHDEQDLIDLIADSSARGFLPKFALSPDAIRGVLSR